MLKKGKSPETVVVLGLFLELLGRFELPTSSLPNIDNLFSLVVCCCALTKKPLIESGVFRSACCTLAQAVFLFRCRFFRCGVGFCVGFSAHHKNRYSRSPLRLRPLPQKMRYKTPRTPSQAFAQGPGFSRNPGNLHTPAQVLRLHDFRVFKEHCGKVRILRLDDRL